MRPPACRRIPPLLPEAKQSWGPRFRQRRDRRIRLGSAGAELPAVRAIQGICRMWRSARVVSSVGQVEVGTTAGRSGVAGPASSIARTRSRSAR
jgi:hypothetical protein